VDDHHLHWSSLRVRVRDAASIGGRCRNGAGVPCPFHATAGATAARWRRPVASKHERHSSPSRASPFGFSVAPSPALVSRHGARYPDRRSAVHAGGRALRGPRRSASLVLRDGVRARLRAPQTPTSSRFQSARRLRSARANESTYLDAVRAPLLDIYSNADAARYPVDPDAIRRMIADHVTAEGIVAERGSGLNYSLLLPPPPAEERLVRRCAGVRSAARCRPPGRRYRSSRR
jgi:hypothetical protein